MKGATAWCLHVHQARDEGAGPEAISMCDARHSFTLSSDRRHVVATHSRWLADGSWRCPSIDSHHVRRVHPRIQSSMFNVVHQLVAGPHADGNSTQTGGKYSVPSPPFCTAVWPMSIYTRRCCPVKVSTVIEWMLHVSARLDLKRQARAQNHLMLLTMYRRRVHVQCRMRGSAFRFSPSPRSP